MRKTYIKYLILFLGIIFLIDFVGGLVLKKYFRDITFGTYGSINNSIKAEADILILGSSRALHHYNPVEISNALKKSCYNTGLGGYGIFFNYALLEEKIRKKVPEMVILDLSPNVIVDKESYSKLNQLMPYYKNHSAFEEIIQLDPKFSKIELISNLYVHNSVLYDFLRDALETNTIENGYIPLTEKMSISDFKPLGLESETFDLNKIKYLNKIIALCKTNDIRLLGVISPTYQKFDSENRIINDLREIFVSQGLEFYDYSKFSGVYQKPTYFKDQLHLNKEGTDIFTKFFVKKISNNE